MTEEAKFNEKEAVKKAKKGSSEHFGLLYDNYLPQIYRFIYLKVMNRYDAEDICQLVFLRAWNNMRGYKDMGFSFSSWLYRIARNAVIDFYRTRKPSVEITSLENILADHKDIQKDLGIAMDAERIVVSLTRLHESHREIIIMKFVEDLSNAEIAHILGKKEGAVRILQHRAIKRLQEIISGDEQIREV